MEPEFATPIGNSHQLSWVNLYRNLILAYQSIGVVFGDLSTSPLYVFRGIFEGTMEKHLNEETVFGAISLIFWTITLIALLKYLVIVLSADDNGEGILRPDFYISDTTLSQHLFVSPILSQGRSFRVYDLIMISPFLGGQLALYSLLCRHANCNLLPNQQADDEELSCYKYGLSQHAAASFPLKRFLEKHKMLREALLLVVLFGACMVIGDGVLTPAISVLSSVVGLQTVVHRFTQEHHILLSCAILVGLFFLQHYGTHKVAFIFAPIIIVWLVSIFSVGAYNIIHWNPKIFRALSPHYIIKFFIMTHGQGWISLGGVLLCITGTEALFLDLGHFTAWSIRIAFAFFVYPCLIIQYMGQAAFLSKNLNSVGNIFYDSIPEPLYWPVFVIASLAAIAASQSVITATFSIIKQCHGLGCFPSVKVVYTSKHIYGQIYIPEINWIFMVLTLAVTIGFQDVLLIGHAYGLAFMTVMLVTTFLMALVIIFVWQKSVYLAMTFLLFFWVIEASFLGGVLTKVSQGGWVPIVFGCIFMLVMYLWHYGTRIKYDFDLQNKASLRWLLSLGPSLGIVRVPGIGVIYSELATGVPIVFSHFVTNLPAFHKVLVFVCVKSVPVPFVSEEERFLVGRVCPRPFCMYRCVVRYGYKDIQSRDENFEDQLIQSIAEFIQIQASEQFLDSERSSFDGGMTVVSTRNPETSLSIVDTEVEDIILENPISGSICKSLQNLQAVYDEENPQLRRRRGRFQIPYNPGMDPAVEEELLDLIQAKEAGVAYILGHSHLKARKSSSFMKKLAIDFGYSFLRNNCRSSAVALNLTYISLIEVGMIYYV